MVRQIMVEQLRSEDRSFCEVTEADLARIRDHALQELKRFLTRAGSSPGKYAGYRDRLLFICLAQGAAQHVVDLNPSATIDERLELPAKMVVAKGYRVDPGGHVVTGVKDIDVFMFFVHDRSRPIPARRHCRKSIIVPLSGLGVRRIDFMKKGVASQVANLNTHVDATAILRRYLVSTAHGRDHLARESIIGLYPENIFGQVMWAVRRLTHKD